MPWGRCHMCNSRVMRSKKNMWPFSHVHGELLVLLLDRICKHIHESYVTKNICVCKLTVMFLLGARSAILAGLSVLRPVLARLLLSVLVLPGPGDARNGRQVGRRRPRQGRLPHLQQEGALVHYPSTLNNWTLMADRGYIPALTSGRGSEDSSSGRGSVIRRHVVLIVNHNSPVYGVKYKRWRFFRQLRR